MKECAGDVCAGEVCASEGLYTLRTLQCVGESFFMRVQVAHYMQVLDCSEGPCTVCR